jgi:hypothetical protein
MERERKRKGPMGLMSPSRHPPRGGGGAGGAVAASAEPKPKADNTQHSDVGVTWALGTAHCALRGSRSAREHRAPRGCPVGEGRLNK